MKTCENYVRLDGLHFDESILSYKFRIFPNIFAKIHGNYRKKSTKSNLEGKIAQFVQWNRFFPHLSLEISCFQKHARLLHSKWYNYSSKSADLETLPFPNLQKVNGRCHMVFARLTTSTHHLITDLTREDNINPSLVCLDMHIYVWEMRSESDLRSYNSFDVHRCLSPAL